MKTLWILFLLTPMLSIFADGKMYRPRVEEVPVGIPYQRAIILHHDQTQTMVLQSQYHLPKGGNPEELAWIIPLPSIPEIYTFDEEMINQVFRILDYNSGPKVHRISWGLIFYGLPIGLVTVLVLGFFQKPQTSTRARCFRVAIYGALFLLLAAIALPSFSKARGGGESVEVVIDKQVGIYAVQVIRSDDATAIAEWLDTHGFAYNQQDKTYFESHVSNQGCFVTARIKPSDKTELEDFKNDGLAAPLIFQFNTPVPMYPLALTGSAGHDTTVLLYLFSDQTYQQDIGLELMFSGEAHHAKGFTNSMLNYMSSSPEYAGLQLPPEETYAHLMKFKATLSPEEMSEDITFTPAPDLPDFRAHITRW